jgi:pimeloyl-ACP methyl ester carboxylesterase
MLKLQVLKVIKFLFPILQFISPPLADYLACYLFVTPIRFPLSEKEKKVQDLARVEWIHVLGKKVPVYFWGEGRPLLFIHGWSGRGTNLFSFVEKLNQQGFQLIAFDAPAHGQAPGTTTDLSQFIEAIARVVKIYGPMDGYIGHSIGGMAAYLFALSTQYCGPLVLIGSPSSQEAIFGTFFRRINGSRKTEENLKKWLLKRTGINVDKDLALSEHPLANPKNLLLIHDEQDKDCPVEQAKRLHAANPGSTLFLTTGLGHRYILRSNDVLGEILRFF